MFSVSRAFVVITLSILMPINASAQKAPETEGDIWTEIGFYGFLTQIEGNAGISNVTAEVDVPFSDLLENLDFAAMALIEHRRRKWSFIGDLFYADIAADNTNAVGANASVTTDVGIKQFILEGFVGYRCLNRNTEMPGWVSMSWVGSDTTGLSLISAPR